MSREADLYKDKIEVSLDGRQIFYLFFGGAVIVGLVFVLGVMVGRRVEARGHVERAHTTAASDPLAALDRLEGNGGLSFKGALMGKEAPSDVERQIQEMRGGHPDGKAAKGDAASASGAPKLDAKLDPTSDALSGVKGDAKLDHKGDASKADAKDHKSDALKADNKGELKADNKGELKADAKGDHKSDALKLDAKGDHKSDALKLDAKGEAKSDAKGEAKSEAKSDHKSEAPKADAKGELKADVKSDHKSEPKADAKSEPKAEHVADAKDHKSDAKSDARSDKSDKAPEKKSETKPDVAVADAFGIAGDKPKSEDKPKSADKSAKYTLQLSSFQDKSEADAFLAQVKDSGFQAYITEATVSGKAFYRVRMGTYKSLESANDAKAELEKTLKKSASVMRL